MSPNSGTLPGKNCHSRGNILNNPSFFLDSESTFESFRVDTHNNTRKDGMRVFSCENLEYWSSLYA